MAEISKTKKYIIGTAIIVVISAIAALLIELIANVRFMRLDNNLKGLRPVAAEEITFDAKAIKEGRPEEGLEYKNQAAYGKYQDMPCSYIATNGYVDKLVIEYSDISAAYFDIIVAYKNRFGYIESCVISDANPTYLTSSTVNIRKDAVGIWVIPVENKTPECKRNTQIQGLWIKNTAQFNHFRFLFVLLAFLCAGIIFVFRDIIAEKFEYGFLIIAVCAGFIFCLAMPLSRVVWDEETHLKSVYWLNYTGIYKYNSFLEGYICGSYENLPFEYSTSYEEYKEVYGRVNALSASTATSPATAYNTATSGFATFSYVFMAVTCTLCGIFKAPFALTYILVRFTNLIMYIMVMFFAIKKLPRGKVLMSAIALMPTPMFIASTVSYDTIVTAFCYLSMAYFFHMLFSKKEAAWWEYLVFIGGMAYASSRKAVYIPLVLSGLILPHKCFKDKKTERIMKAGIIVVFLALMSTFVLPALIKPSGEGDLRGGVTSHAGQLDAIFSNPIGYAGLLLSTMWEHLWDFGIGTETLDNIAYLGGGSLTYVIVIFIVTLTLTCENTVYVQDDKNKWVPEGLTRWTKAVIYFLVFAVMCLIWTSMYLSYTEVGRTVMAGVQGRYYIPLLFPVLFALSFNRVIINWNKKRYNIMCAFVSAFIIFYSIWEVLIAQCAL